jgi:hypothetical protein
MKAKPRGLLLSPSSGAGHVRAAQALGKVPRERWLDPARVAAIAEDALTLVDY